MARSGQGGDVREIRLRRSMRRGLETDPRGHRASPRPYRDSVRPFAGEQRDGRDLRRKAAARVKGRPRARLLVLGDAVRVASGMAERGHRDLARPRAADVDHQEPERAADGRVGAVAGTENAEGTVEADART